MTEPDDGHSIETLAGSATIRPAHAADESSGFAFGRYRLFPKRRLLLAGDQPVELKSRAFEAALALVEACGALVTKQQLEQRLWPDTFVDPHNLDQQISTLRKALGEDRYLIRTETGRGWRLAAPVRMIPTAADVDAPTNLPSAIVPLVGRENVLSTLPDLVGKYRLVTLTGAGGIGKTQLGLEVGRRVLQHFPDGVWVVELAPLTDPELLPNAIARAVGVAHESDRNLLDQLVGILRRQHLLLVIDNCEHLIEAVARDAETLLRAAPTLHILATSREPLKAEGEHVFRMDPLTVPPANLVDVDKLLEHSAVQLFVERARAADHAFRLDERTALAVSKICRHLDGIPLALELAAGCVSTIGLDTLASRLHDRFRLLTSGRRCAFQRHQTLAATLDWSYGLLTPNEQAMLRRLAIFAGSFTLDGAHAVASGDGADLSLATDHVSALVSKSLIALDTRGPATRYRMLDTTRAYAREKLAHSGDFMATARRHVSYYRDRLDKANELWRAGPSTSVPVTTYAAEVDDIRAALTWAFDPDGDQELGVALAAASAPFWMLFSMMSECREIVERALAGLSKVSGDRKRYEMRLQAALAIASMWAEGSVTATRDASQRALDLAQELGDTDHQVQALVARLIYSLRLGDYRAFPAIARRFRQIARKKGNSLGVVMAARLDGVYLFHHGEHARARLIMERVVAKVSPNTRGSFAVRYGFDQRVAAMVYLARILWIQGFPSQAARLTDSALEEARVINHANTLCMVHCDGICAFAALSGDTATLEQSSTVLSGYADKHGLGMWRPLAIAFKGVAAVQRGHFAIGSDFLRSTLNGSNGTRVELRHTTFIEALAGALVAAGRTSEAIATVQTVLDDSLRNHGHWCVPELLRLRGELKTHQDVRTAAAAAQKDFEEAMLWAVRQGASFWQLRAALSLARLQHGQGRASEARATIMPVYDRCTEGFDTTDLQAAAALINQLSPP